MAEEKREKDLNEIEHSKDSENENPMEIHFKNFFMKDLSYEKFEQEKRRSKNEQLSWIWKLVAKLKHWK